jgi:hypothetical protein
VGDAIGIEDHLSWQSHDLLDVTAVRRSDLDAKLTHDLRGDADAAFLFLMAVARVVIVAVFGVAVFGMVIRAFVTRVAFIIMLVGFPSVIVTCVIVVFISMTCGISAGLLVVRMIVAFVLVGFGCAVVVAGVVLVVGGLLGDDRCWPIRPQRQPAKQRQQNQ